MLWRVEPPPSCIAARHTESMADFDPQKRFPMTSAVSRSPEIAALVEAARSDSWEQRYRALERSRGLAVGPRREVASAFLDDSNSWVRNLAERILRSGQRPPRRSRRGIVMEIDNVLKGAKLSAPQRSRLVELYEEAEQLGAFG